MATKNELKMQNIAGRLDKELKALYKGRQCFVLITCPFGENGIADYVSNGNRTDMIKALKEAIGILGNKEDIPTTQGDEQ